jgi:hypothetical protein
VGHLQKRPNFYLGLSLKSSELSAAQHPCVLKNMNLSEYSLNHGASSDCVPLSY